MPTEFSLKYPLLLKDVDDTNLMFGVEIAAFAFGAAYALSDIKFNVSFGRESPLMQIGKILTSILLRTLVL